MEGNKSRRSDQVQFHQDSKQQANLLPQRSSGTGMARSDIFFSAAGWTRPRASNGWILGDLFLPWTGSS